ncbi:MAG: methyl-accepting chemotaxis protein [Lachnospiraceae bacterium]|nr:methyl-accepting chemotaxis protein [Lachnospiraceae bacterium]
MQNTKTDSKKKKAGGKRLFDSVKTRLTCIIIAIMAVPLIAAVLISYVASHAEAVDNMNTMNTAQVNLVEHDFKSIVEQNYQVVQTAAKSMEVRNVLLGKLSRDAIIGWMQETDEGVGDGNVLIVTDADGRQILRTSGECVDVSDRDYFKKCKETGSFQVSDQNVSKSSGQRICTFICPVFNTDGTFIGAVQRNYNLTNLTELVKSEVIAKNQDIFIGDNNGDLIAHTSMDLETGEPGNFSSQQWYAESRNDPEAVGSYKSNFNGGNWRMAYQREPITGWVTVIASDEDVALASSNRMLAIIVGVGLVMLIIAAFIAVALSNSFTKPILAVSDSVAGLSRGEFNRLEDASLLKRKDEFGDIVHNINSVIDELTHVVANIKNASLTVSEQARELSETSGQISGTTDGVSNAVQEMAKGATEQAGTIEKASENLSTLSDAIQTVAQNSEQLASAAADMSEASQSSAEALKQLSYNMDSMGNSVSEITATMNATNTAVQNVNEKVDGITSIASQTNLLALNASIEAARAGEAGKGFAVVAEEIGKLATESATTAQEIRAEMATLLKQAQDALVKAGEVEDIGNNVNEVLENTVNKINELIDGVGSTVDGVNTISGLTEECDASKVVIVDAMSSLSAISEQNAASTEETSASMQELNATINVLAESAQSLNEVAERLNEDLQFFKL